MVVTEGASINALRKGEVIARANKRPIARGLRRSNVGMHKKVDNSAHKRSATVVQSISRGREVVVQGPNGNIQARVTNLSRTADSSPAPTAPLVAALLALEPIRPEALNAMQRAIEEDLEVIEPYGK